MGMGVGTMYSVTRYKAGDWRRLGDRIRRQRIELGLTQDELAEMAVVATTSIGNWEAGRPARLLTLSKLARKLGWTADSCTRILDGKEPELSEEPAPTPADAFVFERPSGMTDDQWDMLKADLVADVERYLRWQSGR